MHNENIKVGWLKIIATVLVRQRILSPRSSVGTKRRRSSADIIKHPQAINIWF